MTSHAIVTTVDGGYSRYLPEWADAVRALDRQPDQVVIVDNGANDPQAVDDAAATTGAEIVRTPWHLHRARARNLAVAASRTEWVQHLDVDDMPEPWALDDTDALRDRADVIAWGWRRHRDGRPTARQRLYTAHRGEWTLNSKAPASAVSPFRRNLWEASPYREDMDGSWDTALWIGFAHLDARFVPTARHCYLYRWHDDSLFRARPADHKRRLGRRLEQLRWAPPDDVAVVVPLRTDDPDRLAAADWLERWYRRHFPTWRWVLADTAGAWNKPRALNDTIARLDVRTLVVTDGDLYVPPANLAEAVRLSAHVPWVIPHETVHRLDRPATAAVYAGHPPDPTRTVMAPYRGVDGGGIFVLTKAQWDLAGGMDDRFDGWGCEDEAFATAANTLLGDRVRLTGPLWHLYHDPGLRARDPSFRHNRRRLAVYRKAAGDRDAMAALVGRIEDEQEAPVGTFRNRRTGKTVTVDPEQPSYRRLQRLDVWEELGAHTATVDTQDVPPARDEPEATDNFVHHTGGGWYEVIVDGQTVDKVRGKQAALDRADELVDA